MLDLNLNVQSMAESTHSNHSNAFLEKLSEGSANQMDESGTSNSSIVNVDVGDDDSSSTRGTAGADVCTFNFDILKVDGAGTDAVETKEFFPLKGVVDQYGESSAKEKWIDLSFDKSNYGNSEGEVRIMQQPSQPAKKSRRGPRSRSSQYRGVTFYRRTGRWESHIWDCGKQVYLGGFDTAHAAARAYDRAAIKFRGVEADINFNLSDYEEDLKQMKNLTKEEFVHILRRQSTGFSRGSSKYRGVTLHKCGRWEARMGQFLGKKAYDKAAIRCNGREAVTNFEPSIYEGEMGPEAISEGTDHNLDLNLGISPPTFGNYPKEIEGHVPLHAEPFGTFYRSTKMDKPTSSMLMNPPFKGLPIMSEHPPTWNGGFFPTEERGKDSTRIQYSSAHPQLQLQPQPQPQSLGQGQGQGLSNWAWQVQQVQGQASAAPRQLLPHTAASSGFSFSISPRSAATPHPSQQLTPAHNIRFPPAPSSFFYHQPPQPPPT